MSASLVGSEMCIRDRCLSELRKRGVQSSPNSGEGGGKSEAPERSERAGACLLYTSDAADDM
eukprot:4475929-Alexandrium_andersonii.AAC.1